MINFRNNISDDLLAWKEEHTLNKKELSPGAIASRSYKIGRLKDLNAIYYKYYALVDQRGDSALRNLGIEKDVLERDIYRKRPFQFIWAKIQEHYQMKRVMADYQRVAEKKIHQVNNLTNKIGLDQPAGLNDQIRIGSKKITAGSFTYQMSDTEMMQYQMELYKGPDGNLHDAYSLRISNSKLSTVKNYVIKLPIRDLVLYPIQAYNLVSGRAVMISNSNGDAKWLKLDLTDRDAEGNYNKAAVINVGDFNLESYLKSSKVVEHFTKAQMDSLISSLNAGQKVRITLPENGENQDRMLWFDPNERAVMTEKVSPKNESLKTEKIKPLMAVPLNEKRKNRRKAAAKIS